MRFVFFILLFISSLSIAAQQRQFPDIISMLDVVKGHDFKKMTRLVDSLDFDVADSTYDNRGGLSYLSKEKVLLGPTIFGCWTGPKHNVLGVSLTVRQEDVYKNLLSQIQALGFKSTDPKFNEPAEGRPVDYEKGKLLISVEITKAPLGKSYDFTLLEL
jgi:hypothetical protein